MKKFDNLIEHTYNVLLEAGAPLPPEAPPAPAAPGADAGGMPPSDGSALPGGGGGGMGGMEGQPPPGPEAQDMQNAEKRKTDPVAYTESILSLLVDEKEGITPDLFNKYIDSIGLASTKIKDRDGFKKFYGQFYSELQHVLSIKEQLKSMFEDLSSTVKDLMGSTANPNDAGGGEGKAGPAGPGVK